MPQYEEKYLFFLPNFLAKGSPVSERQIYETLWRQLEFVQDLVPWVFVVQIVYASIQFIVSICLLVGIMKKRPALMKPWLFITMFSLLAGFAVLCMAFVVMALGELYFRSLFLQFVEDRLNSRNSLIFIWKN